MIDRIRHDIQRRLNQLQSEGEKLRHALAALAPRERSTPPPSRRSSRAVAEPAATTSTAARPAPARAAPGQTKVRVLAALSPDQGLTAGEVATATGLARPTVSTTLSKLAKTGEVVKAQRGYRLPSSDDVNPTATAATPPAS